MSPYNHIQANVYNESDNVQLLDCSFKGEGSLLEFSSTLMVAFKQSLEMEAIFWEIVEPQIEGANSVSYD